MVNEKHRTRRQSEEIEAGGRGRREEKKGQKRGERRRGRDDVKKSEGILDLAKSSDRHWGSTSGPLSSISESDS